MDRERTAYLSRHVLPVQSAYMRAAGSWFARNPTRCGGRLSFCRPSATSVCNRFAIVAARTTLQDGGAPPRLIFLSAIATCRKTTCVRLGDVQGLPRIVILLASQPVRADMNRMLTTQAQRKNSVQIIHSTTERCDKSSRNPTTFDRHAAGTARSCRRLACTSDPDWKIPSTPPA